jgi:hypothetical protein
MYVCIQWLHHNAFYSSYGSLNCVSLCRSIKYLLKVDDLVSAVSQLALSHSISPLLTGVSSSLLENHFSNLSPSMESSSDGADTGALNVLLSLIDEIQLEESCVYQLVK